ncbi:DNA recombination protein RmuC [Ruegeria sp. HKCCD6228]|jgi:DNA recombination protein RmuC|uniref:DNA recombination protein RmuC homolog n=1 Tax=Ruegeria atlantica TaxID=81569 RepID=A0AA91BUB6_9RHOB|nr:MULTISPECIES: DNA recombination protein RmuC [Ruegeria]NOC85015.1 DNA recombination protein RmuC [Ruegeria sp. HKCCD6428]NOC92119.1 DNA recombination protein RmuC [Ruegeria sp. HKCCD6604]NOD96869.1 DNA recombination protein RmuC [Ruegeria sp. HKCCD6228]NOE18928.1 DNA recombination protein RmuC [Ruegeria atlantica]
MIEIAGTQYALNDPVILVGGGVVALILLLLFLSLRAANRSARMAEPLARQMAHLGQHVQQLGQGQEQLRGGLQHVSDTQANAQMQVIQTVEARLASVQQQMNDRLADNAMKSARALAEMQERMKETLHGSSKQTATSLTQLQERLAAIDKAQDNITKLSGDVLSLQDILSNKQRRGMFGEIQLNDIVSKALPADSYSLQATLSNGRRADCLIHLPNPPGPIVIDAKFPLEDFEALAAAQTKADVERCLRAFGAAVKVHIKAISEKYILDGETADGALMFVPSEAIYAELHARLPDVVREGFAARVWIVSPTTCMATLNTMRAILKDARMREQAGAIRKELGLLHKDVDRLGDRVSNLDRHFGQAAKDISEIKISAEKAGRRAQRLDNFDFEEIETKAENGVVPLARHEG